MPDQTQATELFEEALGRATTAGSAEDPNVCDAVATVVESEKARGAPPERVLATLKQIIERAPAPKSTPSTLFTAITAWVVRCFLDAFYGRSQAGG